MKLARVSDISDPTSAAPGELTFHYNGGPMIERPQVVTIFWGAAWASPDHIPTRDRINAFFDFVLISEFINVISGDYSLPAKSIHYGSRAQTVSISDSEPGTPAGAARIVTDAQIQAALGHWITSSKVLAPSGNRLYFIYLPPGTTAQVHDDVSGKTVSSCKVFCGYHSLFAGSGYYAVLPYPCRACTWAPTAADSLTFWSSHELAEMLTDPAADSHPAWFGTGGVEIADPCERADDGSANAGQLGGFTVQAVWSTSEGQCVYSGSPTREPLITVSPFPVPLDQHVSIVVAATDPLTDALVEGDVLVDGNRAGATNAPFDYAFHVRRTLQRGPHGSKWWWYENPVVHVQASGYRLAEVECGFPPPPDNTE